MVGDMKEIRDTALAYYHNLSKEQQHAIYTIFEQMDLDGDGTITIKEFENVLEDVISGDAITRLFRDMDKDGDGSLDFEEAVTFCYVLLNHRIVSCDGCKLSFIKGLYFTCVDCFDYNSYDLCISCYGSRNYVHQHSNFLDNYALLRCKSAAANQPTTASSSVGSGDKYDYSKRLTTPSRSVGPGDESDYSKKLKVAEGIHKGVKVLDIIAQVAVTSGSCTIM